MTSYDEIAPDMISPNDTKGLTLTPDRPLKHLDTVVALYDFPGTQPSHLPLSLGDTVFVLSKSPSGWWDGVIVAQNGDLLRGWFPKNYTRSVNYVQPVLNKLKSNKEIDSITAANTAANVLIPSFTSLLQKNLLETSEKSSPASNTRKNSVVSFASSDTSDKQVSSSHTSKQELPSQVPSHLISKSHSQSSLISSSQQTIMQQGSISSSTYPSQHQQSISTLISGIKDEEKFITDIEKAEQLIEEFREANKDYDRQLTWISRTTTDGNYAYYNEKLDVFSASIPLTTYDSSRDGKILPEIPSVPNLLDTTLVSREAFLGDGISPGMSENRSGSTSDGGLHGDDSAGEGKSETDSVNRSKAASHSKEYETLKRESNASSMNSQSSTGSLYHHFSQPFYAMDGLFYRHPGDLTHWTLLRDQFNFLLDLSSKALRENNKMLFSTHFTHLNKIITILFSCLRLAQEDFVDSKYERSIRRKLKRVASCYTRIYTNGLLHLSVIHYDSGSTGKLFSNDISRLNKSTSTPTKSFSSQTTVVPGDCSGTGSASASASASHTGSARNSNLIDQKESEVLMETLGEIANNETEKEAEDYFSKISVDVESLRYNLNELIKVLLIITEDKRVWKRDYNGGSDTSDDEGEDRSNVLPQIYPRFIAGEFNGGNWCNPFFSQSNPVLNASGDELKTRYHSKIIIDRDAYKSISNFSDEMKKLSENTLKYLDPKVQYQYFNEQLKSERNTQILRLIYKYLYYAGSVVDIIEAFDFTVFCLIKRYKSNEGQADAADINDETSNKNNSNLTFDYPVVLEFFQYKQQFHDIISEIVMATQQLTLEDPEVFKGMKDDDPFLYNRELMKDPKEKAAMLLINILAEDATKVNGDAISLNSDVLMSKSLLDGIAFINNLLTIIQQLIDERETILNYATRVMHDDFNVQLLVIERNNTISSEKSDEARTYFSGDQQATAGSVSGTSGKKKSDYPWYLEGDEEYDLLLDIKGNIKGGSKEALVAHLTHHDLFDASFNSTFFVTFATIMSISEFVALLILRFNIQAPEGLSYEEYNTWITKKQNPIRKRVLTVMKVLTEKYWTFSYASNRSVLKKWINFIYSTSVIQQQYSELGKEIVDNLNKILNGEFVSIERQPTISSSKPPAPLIKGTSLLKKMKLLDIDYIELARQLTIKEFQLYAKINKYACISKVWGRKSGLSESIENISNFIKSSNQLTNYVAYMILRKQDIKKRVQLIRYFVQVAEKCRQYNNYSSMTAIISALYSSPIHRLKKTWKYVSSDSLAHLQNMNKLMNSTRNFNEYRDVLKFIGSEPCVPFFGVFLSDLTFIFHGNSDYLMNRPRMINFAKRAKTFEIVTGMDRFKTTGYNFVTVKEIQQYLDSWFDKCPTIDEQYQLSLNLEPRESIKPAGNLRSNKSK